MEQLLEAGGGLVKLVTLAPERDPDYKVTASLAALGIAVSAGHCDASLEQLSDAIDAGLRLFTHLGNGCPLEMHRHDNIIQRVLHVADRLHIGLVADGVHLPPMTLGNYLNWIGLERAFVVSDAIAAAGMGPGTYELAGQSVVVDEAGGTWTADRSHLVGSASTLADAAQILSKEVGLTPPQIEQLTQQNPRRLLEQSPT